MFNRLSFTSLWEFCLSEFEESPKSDRCSSEDMAGFCFVLRDSLRDRVQSRAPTNSAPCRNFHIMQYHAYGVCWLFLQGKISRLEPRWRRGFHIGGYKKSFQTLLAHLRWDVRIICAPKMRLPGSRQMPVASFVSFIQRRRLPKHWMNQTSACGYLVRNTR